MHVLNHPVCSNILVGTTLSTVKLADVGMSRALVTSSYYRKAARSKVPARWLAIEAMLDRLYTPASDVWSFGVLCWEVRPRAGHVLLRHRVQVFALGAEPYGDMTNEQAVRAVLQGLRLSCPSVCPRDMCEA